MEKEVNSTGQERLAKSKTECDLDLISVAKLSSLLTVSQNKIFFTKFKMNATDTGIAVGD